MNDFKKDQNLTIQSLRAIAVIGVILCHYQFSIFKGGYLGVDIFFAISGYVIAKMIIKELDNKRFSLKNFYYRRFRRIAPAFLFVTFTSIIAAWFILYPSQLVEFSKSTIANIIFISNFFFWSVGTEYGAESNILKPLLHTWSLSVEAQFYFFISVFFLFFLKLNTKQIIAISLSLLILNIIFANEVNKIYSKFNFFFTISRAWEFFFGCILAIYETRIKTNIVFKKIYLEIITALCFVTIIISYIYLEYELEHPSFKTLIVIIPTLVLIYLNNTELTILKILNNKALLFIGAISYSMYLWHYPIISFYTNLSLNLEYFSFFLILILLLISSLSYFYIEQPFRSNKITSTKVYLIFSLSFLILIVSFSILVLINEGFKKRFKLLNSAFGSNEFDNAILKYESYSEYDDYIDSFDGYSSKDIFKFQYEKETFSNNNERQKILIIGNSHSLATWNSFYLNKKLFDNLEFARVLEEIHRFATNEKVVNQLINSPNFKKSNILLISSSYRLEKDKNINYLEGLKKLNEISKIKNKKLIVTIPFRFEFEKGEIPADYLLKKNINFEFSVKNLDTFNNFCYFKKISPFKNALLEFGDKFNIKILDKAEFICDDEKKKCYCFDNDGLKTFHDAGHQTLSGAVFFGKKIKEINWLEAN